MSTKDMKSIIQQASVTLNKPIQCDYFDSDGNMVGECDGKKYEINVPTRVIKFKPDPRNKPDYEESARVFDVAKGTEALIAALKPTRAPKAKATPAKAAPSDAETTATV